MITIRPAEPSDAARVGAIHVAAWRSAYPGILPAAYLARLSAVRQAAAYDHAIRAGQPIFVAAAGQDVIGYASCARAPSTTPPTPGLALADGEVETLYVLDDYRDQGAGRDLLRAAASRLAADGCRSLFLWVLRENPSRWFYERLGGRPGAYGIVPVAGQDIPQQAYVWDPIDLLLTAPLRQG